MALPSTRSSPSRRCFIAASVLCVMLSMCLRFGQASQANTCMSRALRQAGIHPSLIERIAQGMVNVEVDERILGDLEYATMEQTLKEGGIPSWVNRRKIYQCFNEDQQNKRNRSCASRICENQGTCSLDTEAKTHFCQCTSNYYGDFCQIRTTQEGLHAELTNLQAIVRNSGSTYTRWGHNLCPSAATLVYPGFLAGAYFTQTGGGANHLCMPFNPQYVPNVGNSDGAWIYGAEYESANEENSRGAEVHDRNVPCAICEVTLRSRVLMLPARTDCPSGWTREYYGFIMGAHNTHKKGNFICVDREMQILPGLPENQDGDLLYTAGASCSSGTSIDCPPYQHEKPITCCVCTK